MLGDREWSVGHMSSLLLPYIILITGGSTNYRTQQFLSQSPNLNLVQTIFKRFAVEFFTHVVQRTIDYLYKLFVNEQLVLEMVDNAYLP